MNIDSPNNTTSSNSSENDICFICLEANDNTSITPCNCKTSVHHICIVNWINHKSNVFCELCNEQYTIHNIYNNENNNVDVYDNINMNIPNIGVVVPEIDIQENVPERHLNNSRIVVNPNTEQTRYMLMVSYYKCIQLSIALFIIFFILISIIFIT